MNFGGPPKTVASGGGKDRYQPHPVRAAIESGDHLFAIKGNRSDRLGWTGFQHV